MNQVPKVKDEVEMPVLTHTFKFRRLRWQDMPHVSGWIEKHKMAERLAVTAYALHEVSGLPVTPEEALKVLTSLPRAAQETVFKFYKGNLDPHRMFDATPLWKAPDATEYRERLDEEGSETDQVMDEVEEMLTQKFGHKAVEEQKELERLMIAGTGYAGAIRQDEDKMDKTMNREEEYLAKAIHDRNTKEEW